MIYVASDSKQRLYAVSADQPSAVREVTLDALCRRQGAIRICAQYRMSSVIVALLEAERVVDLCSPMLFPQHQRDDPGWLVQALAYDPPAISASVGGYHRAGAVDLASYRLAAAVQRNAAADAIEELFNQHPVAGPLTYLYGLDRLAAGMLIGYARDPRWFINPHCPSRSARFAAFCGASPWRIGHVQQNKPRKPNEWRTYYLLCAWAMAHEPEVAAEHPGGFLYRLKRSDGRRWLMAGSKKFCSFLNYAWLQAIHQEVPTAGNRESIFLPDMVLQTPENVAAYHTHMRAASACV